MNRPDIVVLKHARPEDYIIDFAVGKNENYRDLFPTEISLCTERRTNLIINYLSKQISTQKLCKTSPDFADRPF